ncbi:hypothetical protein M885DRAFT_496180 [Pelagophyceae sp. CCMP2097]|nr:hypothetical protein M885DRAFT_496180 [Pelagophyceae sp. CCMP2097]
MPTLPGKLAADLRIAAAGPRPAAAGLGLLSPWTEWFSPADRKPGPAAGEAGPFQSLRWRGPLALGLVLATGMCAAASTGVSIQFLERRHLRRREAAACGDRRDAVGEWGKRRATEAAALGWLMVRERDFAGDASTFLVPGPLSDGLSLHRLDELSPTYHQTDILWLPTVTQADRPAFEAYLGGAYGGERNITDARSEYAPPENPPENQRLSHVLLADDWAPWNAYDPETAPNRKTYNPVAVVWAAPSSDRPKMDNHVGWDLQERNRRLLPESLYTRLLESHKLIAHPPYDAVGEGTDSAPMADRGLTVQMPFVFADSGVSPGFFYFTLPKDEWNSIFPANLEVSGAETGHLIKTVSPGYGAHVHAHEPFLDLSVKCFYDETHETTAP